MSPHAMNPLSRADRHFVLGLLAAVALLALFIGCIHLAT